ncbi:hypothetical protein TorRG33x02_332920 [Trema orientale]|uniref:Uncharacterized protein n=1 Tax=Trema orientale TaxID=63057 RepID=A0A2P5B4S9_TREOI|nr:hypothetical protein TorRG33x02_332920 [Trema orientale]
MIKQHSTSKNGITIAEEQHVATVAAGRGVKEKTTRLHPYSFLPSFLCFTLNSVSGLRQPLPSILAGVIRFRRKIISLWRKKLVLHSSLAGVSNGQIQNPIIPQPLLPSSGTGFRRIDSVSAGKRKKKVRYWFRKIFKTERNRAGVSPNLHASGDSGCRERKIYGVRENQPGQSAGDGERRRERERESLRSITESLDGFLGVFCS